jgi:hypothetical protein
MQATGTATRRARRPRGGMQQQVNGHPVKEKK